MLSTRAATIADVPANHESTIHRNAKSQCRFLEINSCVSTLQNSVPHKPGNSRNTGLPA